MQKVFLSVLICLLVLTGCGKKEHINNNSNNENINDSKDDDLKLPEEIVIDKLEESKQKAAEISVQGLISTSKLYYLNMVLENASLEPIKINFLQDENGNPIYSANDGKISMSKLNEDGFILDGTIPTDGYLLVDENGNINGVVTIDKFKCEITNGKLVSCEK